VVEQSLALGFVGDRHVVDRLPRIRVSRWATSTKETDCGPVGV
jgi:hypothetical protein